MIKGVVKCIIIWVWVGKLVKGNRVIEIVKVDKELIRGWIFIVLNFLN